MLACSSLGVPSSIPGIVSFFSFFFFFFEATGLFLFLFNPSFAAQVATGTYSSLEPIRTRFLTLRDLAVSHNRPPIASDCLPVVCL